MAESANDNRIDDENLARLMAIEQDIIEDEPQTKVLRAKSKHWLGRLMNGHKLKTINQEIDSAQQEVATILRNNREQGKKIVAFLDTSSRAASTSEAVKQQVAALAQESDPIQFPPGIYLEAEEVLQDITGRFTPEADGTSFILFNTASSTPQPDGLSVAIALQKLGFASPGAVAQFQENFSQSNRGLITTSAVLSGPFTLGVGYLSEGVDVRVSMNISLSVQ